MSEEIIEIEREVVGDRTNYWLYVKTPSDKWVAVRVEEHEYDLLNASGVKQTKIAGV